ncbi:P-loop containing nucleoside triphosphate hydrolase protein [Aspergillus transmontanensis]|uniref:P-loop containing nucleoside triphosphate hydrolase protein n=1 Tax=Aspergillus transmontanensis TaxID=1034304 RepID=A0A5N6VQR2_9EURO|nr:P-loop containing nucleoside triphosphate hydrolase protein [Aspergillus transmontanensis]
MNAEKIYLSHIGWNANVIKNLLLDVQRDFAKRDGNRIIIYRGESRAGASNWGRVASWAARQLSSVILDKGQKDRIVIDVDEYLSQRTRSWYKRNGIPYRRGYLLQWPPGTGKTSLCVALAGRFKMNIYLLSLNSLDELSFSTLFRKVPEGSIILLEDIDRAEGPVSESEESRQTPFSKGISLSALLNEIDGIAAKENRIFVMTTNHAEHLDPALLRPGRVDMTLTFSLANKDTIFRIFCSMYGNNEDMDFVSRNGNPRPLHDLATQFTQQIPADVFSPAEIQEYILQYKSDTEKAADSSSVWVSTVSVEVEMTTQNE